MSAGLRPFSRESRSIRSLKRLGPRGFPPTSVGVRRNPAPTACKNACIYGPSTWVSPPTELATSPDATYDWEAAYGLRLHDEPKAADSSGDVNRTLASWSNQ